MWLAAHAGYRARVSVALTVLALGGLLALTTLPFGAAVLGVSPVAGAIGIGAMLIANVAAVVGHHAFGVRSRAYRVLDHVETFTVQLAAMFLVAASGRGGSCFWLAYLAHTSVLPLEPRGRWTIAAVVLGGPWLVVLHFVLVTHDWTATAFAVCGAAAGWWTWTRTQARKRCVARLTAEREALSRRERTLRVRDERLRLAQELHRNVGAELEVLLALSAAARRERPELDAGLEDLERRTRKSLDDLRSTVWELDRKSRSCEELASYVREMLDDLVADAARLELRVDVGGDEKAVVPGMHALALIRVLQESTRNALTHGKARVLRVGVMLGPEALRATVEDDGAGMPAEIRRSGGLSNMKARARKLGGALSITSERGTRVVLELPLGAATERAE